VGAGYAYILTHPGVPCVFWEHLFENGEPLSQQIYDLMKVREQGDGSLWDELVTSAAQVAYHARHWFSLSCAVMY